MSPRAGAAALDTKSSIRKVRIRGVVYTLRELTIGEYDECVTKATEKRTNPLTEREEEFVNQTTLLRHMVAKSSGISIGKQADLEMPVVLTLNKLVNDMHFPDTEGKDKLWESVDETDGAEGPETAGEG
jgi:hypothetical protein